MKKSEKSKLIKALSALVEKNGPEFPSEHPTEMVEKLVERCGESVLVGAVYFAALSGIFDAAMRDDVTKEALVEEIERKCAFRKAFAEELAELCLSVYSAKELAGLKEKKGAQFEALCGLSEWLFDWKGETEWHSGGGYVTCTGDGSAALRVCDRKKLEAWLREKQPRYEYSTLEELTGCIAEALRSQMDGAFEEYCQEDDYYEPVAEDFEFERELREAAGEMGIEVLWTDYDGDISDYEMERHRW